MSTTHTYMATHGLYGNLFAPNITAEQCLVTFALLRPNGQPWSRGIIRATMNKDVEIKAAGGARLFVVAAHEESTLTLNENGVGAIPLFRQINSYPLDNQGQATVSYFLRFPDATTWQVVIPDQISVDFTELSRLQVG